MNKVIQISSFSSHKKTVNTISESTIDIEDAMKKINNEKIKNEIINKYIAK